jgi:hypothetical protein
VAFPHTENAISFAHVWTKLIEIIHSFSPSSTNRSMFALAIAFDIAASSPLATP